MFNHFLSLVGRMIKSIISYMANFIYCFNNLRFVEAIKRAGYENLKRRLTQAQG